MLQLLLAGQVAVDSIADHGNGSRSRSPNTLGHQLRNEMLSCSNIPSRGQHRDHNHIAMLKQGFEFGLQRRLGGNAGCGVIDANVITAGICGFDVFGIGTKAQVDRAKIFTARFGRISQ